MFYTHIYTYPRMLAELEEFEKKRCHFNLCEVGAFGRLTSFQKSSPEIFHPPPPMTRVLGAVHQEVATPTRYHHQVIAQTLGYPLEEQRWGTTMHGKIVYTPSGNLTIKNGKYHRLKMYLLLKMVGFPLL